MGIHFDVTRVKSEAAAPATHGLREIFSRQIPAPTRGVLRRSAQRQEAGRAAPAC
jgi:hypothetical protein